MKEAIKEDLYNKVVQEISEYTGEKEEAIRQKHKIGPESEANFYIFREQANLTKDNVEDFYKKCSYYLYELPLWNAERNRPRYLSMITLPYLRRNGYKKVMDFGAGTGDFCIELAENNFDVAYCDIGKETSRFAEWRFSKRNLNIKIIEDFEVDQEKYDCIFSFDTLEHLKNLPEIVRKISERIRRGDSLIFSSAFSGGTLHLEENERYNEFNNLDALMRSCGLIFQDKFAQFYFYKNGS